MMSARHTLWKMSLFVIMIFSIIVMLMYLRIISNDHVARVTLNQKPDGRGRHKIEFADDVKVDNDNKLSMEKLGFIQVGVPDPNNILEDTATSKLSTADEIDSESYFVKNCETMHKTFSDNGANIHMGAVHEEIKFDNIDGGVWKQGIPLEYSKDSWSASNPLQVFVIPHSHNDPGWLKTFQDYYDKQTKPILNNIVDFLSENKNRRFIWAEISYFKLWWDSQSDLRRNQVRDLVEGKQLEFVTGGWVMPDEANTHYFAILDQLIVGHRWLQANLGPNARPRTGWAIDPFGHTPTMAYLLKQAGIRAMLIQRVHYSVKKRLAQTRDLEFFWRQSWDHTGTTDIYTHMMPFYSYDIPHTCGPDPKICCQFDFARLSSSGLNIRCPWNVPPVPITPDNVDARAAMLVDQYKKKAALFGHGKSVLIPLGDDFRYSSRKEFENQMSNYETLMRHINANLDKFQVSIKWGTLREYFESVTVTDELTGQVTAHSVIKTLSGDFYTYADRDDHYWSGYFSTRAFSKVMDRVLEESLRAAEILNAASRVWSRSANFTDLISEQMEKLTLARENLGLFQHHDGITGTAKNAVVQDYGQRLLKSLTDSELVMSSSAQVLLQDIDPLLPKSDILVSGAHRASWDALPEDRLLSLQDGSRHVVVFNSLPRPHKTVLSLVIDTPTACVRNEAAGNVWIPSQTDLIWKNEDRLPVRGRYRLWFLATLGPLSLAKFYVESGHTCDRNVALISTKSTVHIYNSNLESDTSGSHDIMRSTKTVPIGTTFSAGFVTGSLGFDGRVVGVELEGGAKYSLTESFHYYSSTKSGAYLFMPQGGPSKPASQKPHVRIVRGQLVSEAYYAVNNIARTARIRASGGIDGAGIEMVNRIDLRNERNMEFCVVYDTGIKNGPLFYTDLNGFMTQRRETLAKLPIQGNFYPMPSQAFIEDVSLKTRFSVHSKEPVGVASLTEGRLEFMIDRTLNQDDNRGLQQGIRDNHPTDVTFFLMFEEKLVGRVADRIASFLPKRSSPRTPVVHMSLYGHAISQVLNHPLHIFHVDMYANMDLKMERLLVSQNFPSDMELLNMRMLETSEDDIALLVRRHAFDCRYAPRIHVIIQHQNFLGLTTGGSVDLEFTLWPSFVISSAVATEITFVGGKKYDKGVVAGEARLIPMKGNQKSKALMHIPPMDIFAVFASVLPLTELPDIKWDP